LSRPHGGGDIDREELLSGEVIGGEATAEQQAEKHRHEPGIRLRQKPIENVT
jgi:hypothetical protein